MSDAAFDALSREFVDLVARRDPITATYLGIHTYDGEMPSGTRAHILEDAQLYREYRERFAAFPAKSLSRHRALDRDLIVGELDLWVFETEELRGWESRIDGPLAVGSGLFGVFARDFAPLPDRLRSLASRLGGVPRFLDETKTRLRRPIRLWTQIGIDATKGLPGFVDVIVAQSNLLSGDEARTLKANAAAARASLLSFESWLTKRVLPRGGTAWPIGRKRFETLLRLRGIPLEMDEIYALGQRYLRESKRALRRAANDVKKGASVKEAGDIVKAKQPRTFEDALAAYRQAMADAREFVRGKDLATLPPRETLTVMETPEYLRTLLPFAAYVPPGKFDAKPVGVYLVTPPGEGKAVLREHAYAEIRNTSVHEAYPGHHLQLSCASLHPSPLRALLGAPETVEGWAHYCEEMMREQGFDDSPEMRFVQTKDVIWRACRIILDIDLHTRKKTFREAVDFLVRHMGMARAGAEAEVKRYTQHPAYQLSYLLGKHLFLELRDEVRRRVGPRYTDKFFHDTILYGGSMPFRFVRESFREKLGQLEELAEKGV